MQKYDYKDVISGVLMILFGLFAALYSMEYYRLGSVSRMGPGMFPAALGWILVGLGVLVIIPAMFRSGQLPKVNWRPFVTCLVAVSAFGFLAEHTGVIAALLVSSVISVLGDNKLGVRGTIILSVSITLIAWVIFFAALDMTMPLFKWDWRF